MIEPNLFALLGPGTGSARKPDMTLKADVASIFERFMQTGPQGSEESAMGAFPAEMGFAAPLPDPAVLQAKEVGELSISQGKHSDVTSKLAVDLPFGSAFSEQAGMRGPSVDVPRLSFTSSVAVGSATPPARPPDLAQVGQADILPPADSPLPAAPPLISTAGEPGNTLAGDLAELPLGEQNGMRLPSANAPPLSIAPSAAPQSATLASPPTELAPAVRPGISAPANDAPLSLAPQPISTPVESAGALAEEVARPPRTTSPDLSASTALSGQPKQQVAAQPVLAAPVVTHQAPNPGESVSANVNPGPDEVIPASLVDRPPNTATPTEAPANALHPNPQSAAIGPALSPIAPSKQARQPNEGRPTPKPGLAPDHPPTPQLAGTAPVVTSWFRQRADMPNPVPLVAEVTGSAPRSDQVRSVAARAEIEAAFVADRPASQEMSLAAIAPLTTPAGTPADALAVLADPAIDLAAAEVQRATSPAAETGRTAPAFAEHAPRVIEAIAHAARALADRPVELVLNPEELGRLRMTLVPSDGGMTVQLTVERPETLELLRRHIDLLASDLRQAGYDRLSFGFAADQQAGGQPTPEHANRQETATQQDTAPVTDPAQQPGMLSLTLSGGGLDLRL